ncbi:hypothetical protein BOTU111921_29335 [Bordetella tumbae]
MIESKPNSLSDASFSSSSRAICRCVEINPVNTRSSSSENVPPAMVSCSGSSSRAGSAAGEGSDTRSSAFGALVSLWTCTRPSLVARMICWPNSWAACAGASIAPNPSAVNTSYHPCGLKAGVPGIRTASSSASHQPSSNPKVRCKNRLASLNSLSSSNPLPLSSVFTCRKVLLISRVACSTFAATTTS